MLYVISHLAVVMLTEYLSWGFPIFISADQSEHRNPNSNSTTSWVLKQFPNQLIAPPPSVQQVLCEAVYYAVCVLRLRPEDQDVLVEFPRVERVVQRVPRVRPPQGFALSQARHQARKVHMLHTMLKVSQKETHVQG